MMNYIFKHTKVLLGALILCSLLVFIGLNNYLFRSGTLFLPGVPVKATFNNLIKKSLHISSSLTLDNTIEKSDVTLKDANQDRYIKAKFDNLIKRSVHISSSLTPDNTIENTDITLKDGNQDRYFIAFNGKTSCLKEGTRKSHVTHNGTDLSYCICNSGWFGKHCSVPRSVKTTSLPFKIHELQIRPTPRRILIFFGFNHEFDILEIRLRETYDLVDAFVILESNYTKFGEPKPQYLLQKMKSGYLKEFQDKIVYVFLDRFLEKNQKSWETETLCRRHLGREGIKRIKNLHDDDIIIFQDADEIPSRETLLFFKLHDGYSEPIGFSLRWSVYGFYWKYPTPTEIYAAGTVKTMRRVNWDIHSLRKGPTFLIEEFKTLNKGLQQQGQQTLLKDTDYSMQKHLKILQDNSLKMKSALETMQNGADALHKDLNKLLKGTGMFEKSNDTLKTDAETLQRSIKLLQKDNAALQNDTKAVKKALEILQNDTKTLQKAPETLSLKSWTIGNAYLPAGWHCSWCFSPEGIARKLTSAVNADFPRWGDYPEKRNLTYIKSLIRRCLWFSNDPLYPGQRITTPHRDTFYAPKYAMDNYEKYMHILSNPFITMKDNIQNYEENQKILTWFQTNKNRKT